MQTNILKIAKSKKRETELSRFCQNQIVYKHEILY